AFCFNSLCCIFNQVFISFSNDSLCSNHCSCGNRCSFYCAFSAFCQRFRCIRMRTTLTLVGIARTTVTTATTCFAVAFSRICCVCSGFCSSIGCHYVLALYFIGSALTVLLATTAVAVTTLLLVLVLLLALATVVVTITAAIFLF